MLEICKELFSRWNESDIKYCHWKSNEHLDQGLNGDTDLDLYVTPSDRKEAESILSECNYLQCSVQKGHRYPNVVEWIGFDKETGHLVHVHLHYEIITGTKYCKEYMFPIDDVIINSRILDKDSSVYVTNPNLEIIILYSRIALKAKNHKMICPDGDDTKEISYLKRIITYETVATVCEQLIGTSGNALYNLIIKDELTFKEWNEIYKIVEKWLRPYRKYSRISVFCKHYYYLLREYSILVLRKLFKIRIVNQKTFPPHGISVCFLGQDGSGKSTVTIELNKWLNWKIEASRFYLGSGDHYNGLFKRLISYGSNMLHKRKKTVQYQVANQNSATNKPVKRPKNLRNFISSVIVCNYFLSLSKRAYNVSKESQQYMKRGGIALFDRFPQMQFEGISDGPRISKYIRENGLDYSLNKWMSKKENLYFEKINKNHPTLVFKLLLPPEESIRRKPFEDIQDVTRKHQIVRNLAFPNSTVYEIDATQDYQQELIEIKNKIWLELLKAQG